MLMTFLWRSGVRITEAVSLRKCDIDFANYTMKLRWLKSRKYQHRIAPMHPYLKDMLQLYTASMLAEDRVFPITRQWAWQCCKKYLGGHPHQIRHSFAVNWLRSGGDIVILHRILGHAKIQTTMEYLKIVPIDQGKELLKVTF
jgi:integrase